TARTRSFSMASSSPASSAPAGSTPLCASPPLCAIIDLMCVLFALLFLAVHAAGQPVAIKCGRFFDGRNLKLQENVVVLIEGKRVSAAGASLAIPVGAKVIDLSRLTVMPGLVDCHTHMFLHGIAYDEALLKKSQQYRAIWATVAARKTLLAGFTTIRDLETEGAGYGDAA